MRKEFVGIHRRLGAGGEPNSAWISSEGMGERVTEDEYRARGYSPEFESLPVLVVERTAVRELSTDDLDQLEADDREMVEEWMKKNDARRT
ncbi:hypothetical protein [Mesorhizobium sp. LjNodule214]|uniref:hypothetical protein n=1 Tax=Mesorhizobium sp. LjNodule214 TaxID=3342252 RepID=UPI003ECC7C5D